MTDMATISIRRNHVRREVTAETLIRDAHLLLDTAGVVRGHNWVARTVREYVASDWRALPFGMFLAAKVELNEAQRRVLAERADLRYLMTYADPTGETAVRHVMKERGF
jgi:hypothetical protein